MPSTALDSCQGCKDDGKRTLTPASLLLYYRPRRYSHGARMPIAPLSLSARFTRVARTGRFAAVLLPMTKTILAFSAS
jgi:hypothetical protein